MSYYGCICISYEKQPTRLQRLRAIDDRNNQLMATLLELESVWEKNPHGQDQRRDACTAVLAALTSHALATGVTLFAKERLNDVLVAFDELHSGRRSVLLAPAPVHPLSYSMTDLTQQAVAQVCVDVFRAAGLPAGEARRHTAGLFDKHKLPKFGESKLRAIGSRLKGPGSTLDPAYDLYAWASGYAERIRANMNLPVLNRSRAFRLTDKLVALTKRRDHRHDFYFAPGEDGSEVR